MKITITLDIPDGTTFSIAQSPSDDPAELVARYWRDFLSPNGRKVYGAAANIETLRGPGYTFEDIAQSLSVTYESAKSWHRSSGRSARVWKEQTGTEPPIRLEAIAYSEVDRRGSQRTSYRLADDMAEIVYELPAIPPE
jgi:hypothetical protein